LKNGEGIDQTNSLKCSALCAFRK